MIFFLETSYAVSTFSHAIASSPRPPSPQGLSPCHSLPVRNSFFEPFAGSCRVGGTAISLTLFFRPACSCGCLLAFFYNI
nr:MAG TPA: hypothetical protein [Inoviridae sp.]